MGYFVYTQKVSTMSWPFLYSAFVFLLRPKDLVLCTFGIIRSHVTLRKCMPYTLSLSLRLGFIVTLTRSPRRSRSIHIWNAECDKNLGGGIPVRMSKS